LLDTFLGGRNYNLSLKGDLIMKNEYSLPSPNNRESLEDLNHLIEFLKNKLDVCKEQLDRGLDPYLINQSISATLQQIEALESEKEALLTRTILLDSPTLNSIEQSCFYGDTEVDYQLKEKWDKHIENWLTNESYKLRVATDCVFRNSVVPGYKERSMQFLNNRW
jgi:hypothetical protein